MIVTKYHNTDDDTLIAKAEEAATWSPLIAELLRRWQVSQETPHNANNRVECPVCEAQLHVFLDKDNDMYELEIDKESTRT